MKKVALLTIDSINFGNKLQNYATQVVIDRLGIKIKTLKYIRGKNSSLLIGFMNNLKLQIQRGVSPILKAKNKYYAFIDFAKKIKWGETVNDTNISWQKVCKQYDYIVVGSDQVWNTEFFPYLDYFLPYVEPSKRIAFSCSVGIDHIKENLKDDVAKNLKLFSKISVREETGADVVEQLIGSRPIVLLDPTLLLDASDWMKIEKRPFYIKNNSKKYVLTYFLGNKPDNFDSLIQTIKNKYDLLLIDISDHINDKTKNIGPAEFIYLVHNATLILTDSFHGSVFSFLFDKPFYVFDRIDNCSNMNSRLVTLFDKLKLIGRYSLDMNIDNLLEHDYSQSYKLLETERVESINFFEDAFNLDK